MITKWYRILKSLRSGGYQSSTFPTKSVKEIGGTSRTIASSGGCATNYPIMSGKVFPNVYVSGSQDMEISSIGIFIGSGNTPATDEDYVLENPLTSSSVSRTSSTPGASAILDDGGNIIGVRRTVTYQNITNSNITVSEIGTYWRTPEYTGTSSSNIYTFLIERTVLDTPIVLAPNDTITVAFDETY